MDNGLDFKKLSGLLGDLREARKAVETFDAEDIRNMFDQAGCVVEFDNSRRCCNAYEASNVDELIDASISLVDRLITKSDDFVMEEFEEDYYYDY